MSPGRNKSEVGIILADISIKVSGHFSLWLVSLYLAAILNELAREVCASPGVSLFYRNALG